MALRNGDALEFLNNPVCYADVYEIEDEDQYVRCKVSAARVTFYGLAAIFIVVIILLAALPMGRSVLLPTFLIGGFILLLSGASAFWFAEWSARRQFQASEYEIDQTLKSHNGEISRGTAINIIRQEKLQREQAASRIRASNIQANAMRQGFSSLRR